MKPSESPGELIQPGSKAVSEFPNKQRNLRRNGFGLHANDVPKLLRIILARDGIRFWHQRLSEFGIEFIEVLFRPSGFQLQMS